MAGQEFNNLKVEDNLAGSMQEQASVQEVTVLREHVKALEDMLSSTTAYLLQIQEQLEVSRQQLQDQNKDLERLVDERTARLRQTVINLKKEVQERERVQQNLHIANHELNTLLYRSSHDFKGPVCTAFGLLSLIGNRIEDRELNEYVHLLQRPLKRLDALTRTITSIAEFREREVKLQPVDTVLLIRKLQEDFASLLGDDFPGLELRVKAPGIFLSDEHFVESIIRSLIDNALRYRLPGRKQRIIISLEPFYKQLKITVADNGTGIPPAFQPRIFDMFFRGSELSTGSGLGLYLSKLAVDKLDGKIKVKSEVNKGTSVSVYLPGL